MARIIDYLRGFLRNDVTIDVRSAAYKNMMGELHYKELAIRQAVSIIAGMISRCEFKFFYDGKPDDLSQEFYAWNVSPNENQNAAEFKAKVIEELLFNGEALIFEKSGGRYCADSFTVVKEGVKPYRFENVTINGVSFDRPMKRKDVIYLSLGSCEITSLIESIYKSYGKIVAAAITKYENSSGSKWKLKISAAARANKDFKENYEKLTQENLKAFFAAVNAVYPEFEGYDLIQLPATTSASISDVTTVVDHVFSSVGSAYKIPNSIYTGKAVSEADRKQFLTGCIEPIVRIIATELTKQFFTEEQWKCNNYCDVDTTSLSGLDIVQVAGAVEKFIGSGALNIDEVRTRILGLDPLNTEMSQKYWITKNFADIQEANAGFSADEGGDDEE